jgi:3-phenylpropionate/trans-cinnamate dioxygenase ferredoxin reductase subunit
MAGKGEPYAKIPYFYTDQYDFSMEYHGWVGPEGYDEVVYRGADDGEDDESQHEFIAFWLRGGRVQAAMNVNVWDQTDAIKALARAQARVDAANLADTSVDLAVLAAAATSATSAPTSR